MTTRCPGTTRRSARCATYRRPVEPTRLPCPRAVARLASCALLAVAIAAPPAGAAAGVDAIDAVLACRGERDEARRLACFDDAAARLGEPRTATGTAAAGTAVSAGAGAVAGSGTVTAGAAAAASTAAAPGAPSVAAMTPEERFGFRGEVAREALDRQRAELPELERLTSTVQSASRQAGGDFVVALANGQVWAQLPTGTPQRLKVGDEVTISPAALGSYMMKLPNGRGVRVKRVR